MNTPTWMPTMLHLLGEEKSDKFTGLTKNEADSLIAPKSIDKYPTMRWFSTVLLSVLSVWATLYGITKSIEQSQEKNILPKNSKISPQESQKMLHDTLIKNDSIDVYNTDQNIKK